MPRPRNLTMRGRNYYFRQMIDGRVVRRSLGSDYQLALARLRSLKDVGLPSELAVEEVASRWLEESVPLHRKDVALAKQRVRDYLVPCLGHFLVGRLSREDCRGYRAWLEKQGKSPQTVKHILSDLRCLLNWCEDAGFLDRSPFPRRIMPRIQERPPDRLTDEDLGRVCALPDPHGFVCRFLVSTGLRWSEGVRAQASDVRDGMLVVSRTKSSRVRRVPVPVEALRRVGRLVPFASHGAFSRYVAKQAGIRFHVHQLRHTYACLWLERGGSLAALQELLGHSTIVTTQRYGRLAEAHVRAEAERVGPLVTEVVTAALTREVSS